MGVVETVEERRLLCATRVAVIAMLSATQVGAQSPDEPAESIGDLSADKLAQQEQAKAVNGQILELFAQGRYADAMTRAEELLDLSKAAFGENSPEYGTTLANLAYLHLKMGDAARARPLYEQALAIRKESLGEQHADYATNLNDLGMLHATLGEAKQAETYYLQAIALQREALGPRHSAYANTLNNLGQLYSTTENAARAGPLYREALDILKEALGEKHADYLSCLNNLGLLYIELGDYARAEPLLRQVVDTRREIVGPRHPDYAASLNNLAMLYTTMEEFARAEPLQDEALAIWKESLGETHPYYATSLNNLAQLYLGRRQVERAVALYQEALVIRKKVLGESHPDYAVSLNNLAMAYDSTGDWALAQPLYEQALEIFRQAVGELHPFYTTNLNNLAFLHRALGDAAKAQPLYRQALDGVLKQVEAKAIEQDEAGQLRLSASVQFYLDNYLSCLLETGDADAAYEAVLGWKGLILARQRAARLAAGNEELAPLLTELQTVVRQWSALIVTTSADDPSWRQRLNELAARKERLEAQLSGRSAAYRNATAAVTVKELNAALPEDAALVDFFEYGRSKYVEVPARGGLGAMLEAVDAGARVNAIVPGGAADVDGRLQPGDLIIAGAESGEPLASVAGLPLDQIVARIVGDAGSTVQLKVQRTEGDGTTVELDYDVARARIPGQPTKRLEFETSILAFIVRANEPVRMFDLGEAAPINAAVEAWRQDFGQSDAARTAGALLRERLWTPLEGAMGDAELVLVSADGSLGKLPFGALPGSRPDTHLIEDVAVACMPVPRLIPELLGRFEPMTMPRDLLVVGGVDYDSRASLEAKPADAPRRTAPWDRGKARRQQELTDDFDWSYLPATDGESAYVATMYQRWMDLPANNDRVVYLRGSDATEEAFRQAAGECYLLHIATHGYSATDDNRPTADEAAAGDARSDDLAKEESEVREYGPGLLSGLVLAGANDPPRIPEDPAEFATLPEDGYLTVDEISLLPLGGARLVVLSACESGLGEAADGEGLLGIQRAFQVAGARTTIATLWKVDDEATRKIMEEFYRNYLEREMSPLESLRAAQLWALNHPDLAPRGADAPDDAPGMMRLPPQFWAAFTLSGDWR